jgi:glucan biosynthesis protein
MSLWRKRNVHHNEQKHDNLPMIWVDPPEGWKYGFPAIYDTDTDGQMSDWIVKKGYPISLIQEYGDAWAVRCWPVEVKPSDEF